MRGATEPKQSTSTLRRRLQRLRIHEQMPRILLIAEIALRIVRYRLYEAVGRQNIFVFSISKVVYLAVSRENTSVALSQHLCRALSVRMNELPIVSKKIHRTPSGLRIKTVLRRLEFEPHEHFACLERNLGRHQKQESDHVYAARLYGNEPGEIIDENMQPDERMDMAHDERSTYAATESPNANGFLVPIHFDANYSETGIIGSRRTHTVANRVPDEPVVVVKSCRILVYDHTANAYIFGRDAPTPANLHQWLNDHPSCEIVKSGTPMAEVFLKSRRQCNAQISAELDWTVQARPSIEYHFEMPANSAQQPASSPSDWYGTIDNIELRGIFIGSNSSETSYDLQQELPVALDIFAYVQSNKVSYYAPIEPGTQTISAIQFVPRCPADNDGFVRLQQSLQSFNRIGLIQLNSESINQVYVVPAAQLYYLPSPIPEIIGENLASIVDDSLIGIVATDNADVPADFEAVIAYDETWTKTVQSQCEFHC